MKYLRQFMMILLVSFLGELLKYAIPLPVPASIYGLVILFILLETGALKLDAVKDTAIFLIEIMPLMFIPAGTDGVLGRLKQYAGRSHCDYDSIYRAGYGCIRKSDRAGIKTLCPEERGNKR